MYDIVDRTSAILGQISRAKTVKSEKVENILYKPCDFKSGSDMPDTADMTPFLDGETWGGGVEKHAWFYARINFKKSEYKRLLRISSMMADAWYCPQIILYIDGEIKQGMDVNHPDYLIEEEGEHDVYVYACTRTADHRLKKVNDFLPFSMCVDYVDERVETLYYDLSVPYGILEYVDKNSDEYLKVYSIVDKAISMLDLRKIGSEAFIKSAVKTSEYLNKNFYDKDKGEKPMVACVGHTHIDVAWLWRLRQTVEKSQRSFATVIELMRRYPSYRFMSSQVPLYKAVKKEAPALYEKIKERIKEGRWEADGGMYVEADCNITGGEGLVRQFMYGKRFFKQEFDVDSKVLWLPDVFGYSAALPQIMKKCGVDDFVTSKISWNDTNTMPYDTFSWQGIDGSEVTTHFILGQKDTNWKRGNTYNSQISSASVCGTYFRNQQRQVSSQALMTVGYGDGGGGTTTHDVEYVERMKNPLPALPSARFTSVKEYIDTAKANIAKNEKELPKWIGELYLEYHRGTYTSQANNKKYNRKSEFGMCNVEALSVLANKFGIDGFDKAEHDKKWEDILINQFHDILPGSSINEVYKDSDYMYGKIFEYINGMTQKLLNGIAKNVQSSGFLVYNPNSFTLTGAVSYEGKKYNVNGIPAKGYKVVSLKEGKSKVKASKSGLESDYLKITLDKNKNIVSVYDKKNDREVLKKGKSIRFVAYEDLPNKYDAWEIAHYYKEKEFAVNDVVSCEVVKDNCGAGIKTVRKLGDSIITDTMYLYDDKDVVEFDDNIDWKESHVLLKREFPIDVVTDRASCEIQYGYADRSTTRNTSWDSAKFEVCAHKYVDVSENDYGVSLINESKFGHGLYDNDISLTLLRSPKTPDAECDMKVHEMKYALCPHKGSLANSDTLKKAYEINNPAIVVPSVGGGDLPDTYAPICVKNDELVVEAFKIAEDGNGVVIRAYEPMRKRGVAQINVGFGNKAYVCDMLENEIEEIEIVDGKIILPYKPFEIITIKVK